LGAARRDRVQSELSIGAQLNASRTVIRHGIDVHAFNQRTIAQILDMVRTLSGLVGAADRLNAPFAADSSEDAERRLTFSATS
jgi:hypothetical protein